MIATWYKHYFVSAVAMQHIGLAWLVFASIPGSAMVQSGIADAPLCRSCESRLVKTPVHNGDSAMLSCPRCGVAELIPRARSFHARRA